MGFRLGPHWEPEHIQLFASQLLYVCFWMHAYVVLKQRVEHLLRSTKSGRQTLKKPQNQCDRSQRFPGWRDGLVCGHISTLMLLSTKNDVIINMLECKLNFFLLERQFLKRNKIISCTLNNSWKIPPSNPVPPSNTKVGQHTNHEESRQEFSRSHSPKDTVSLPFFFLKLQF